MTIKPISDTALTGLRTWMKLPPDHELRMAAIVIQRVVARLDAERARADALAVALRSVACGNCDCGTRGVCGPCVAGQALAGEPS